MQIGTEVKIVNDGKIYTTYSDMFEIMGFKNKSENVNPQRGEFWKTFTAARLHPDKDSRILVGIENEYGDQLLIGVSGLYVPESTVDSCTITVTK